VSSPWIKKWAQERNDPKTLAHLVRRHYRNQYALFLALKMVRRFMAYEALRDQETKQAAAQRMGICVNTMTKTCKEFDIDGEAIKEIRSISDPDRAPAKGSVVPKQ
jgi:hypothetical protein